MCACHARARAAARTNTSHTDFDQPIVFDVAIGGIGKGALAWIIAPRPCNGPRHVFIRLTVASAVTSNTLILERTLRSASLCSW